MMMKSDFVRFNVFGLIRVEPAHIHVMANGVMPGGRSVEHSYAVDLPAPLEGVDGTVVILFAADLASGGKINAFTQNLSARVGGPDLSGNAEVGKALRTALKKFG